MKRTAEIVVIGGGVVGASVAYHLTERGARDVLVLDRGVRQGEGSTGKATGGVRCQFGTDINILMSKYSIDFFADWDHDTGYEPRGYLFFAADERQLDHLRRNVERQRSLGVDSVELLDQAAVKELCPLLECGDIVGGTIGKCDGFIDPMAILAGFTDGALDRGAQLELGCEVTSINVTSGRVTSISTTNGDIECGTVVLANGAWAASLAATAGISLPLEPMRRQIAWARTPNPLPEGLPMVIDVGSGFHFRPARASVDELLFAWPDPSEHSSFSTEFDPAFASKVMDLARARVPELAGDAVIVNEKCRAGLYENTPDHHAILGRCEVDGLLLACGFSGHGVMHSPATGRAIAEIIIDGAVRFLDVTSLSIERFANGELLEETAFV